MSKQEKTKPKDDINLKIDTDISEDRSAKLTVEVPCDELKNKYNKADKEFNRSVAVPGFRPGKAPIQMAIRMHQPKYLLFLEDKADEFTRDFAVEAISQGELHPGGQISLNILEHGRDKALKFEVMFPLPPEVTLSKYKGFSLVVNEAEINDDDISREINAFRHKHSKCIEITEASSADSVLILRTQNVDPSGLELIGEKPKELVIEFGADSLGIGTDEQLIGIKAGEKRIVKAKSKGILSASPQSSKIVSPSEALGQDIMNSTDNFISVEALRVERFDVPDVNDEFVKLIDPGLKNVDELKKWIEINLLGIVTYNTKQELTTRLINALIRENPFEIHPQIIDNLMDNNFEDEKLSEEELENRIADNRKQIEKEYRWTLLRNKIGEIEEIKVNDDDLEAEFEVISRESRKSIDEIRKYYTVKEHFDRITTGIFERKVLEFLKENSEIEKRKMSLDEFAETTRDF